MELVKQDMRSQEREMNDLLNKLSSLEHENSRIKDSLALEHKLQKNIADLEDQIAEKNKVSLYSSHF